MASFAPIRGTRAQIQATPIVDGQFLVETDQGVDNKIYMDEGSTRTIVGGNTVTGVLPELYIYSETGSVVTVEDAGGTSIPTSQVGTDHWICEVPDYGVYNVYSLLDGETTTQSINVTDCMIYTIDDSHFHCNVVVTYPSGVGASCQISGGGETYSAPALNPPDTSYKFVVHGKNTTYTITTNVDGVIKTATVTTGTTLDQTYNVSITYARVNLTVETPPITGNITCTDGTTTITRPVAANITLYLDLGTWTISGGDGVDTYDTEVVVSDLTVTYEADLSTAPDGATVLPTDDVQIWLRCVKIKDKTSYTLDDVLNDDETLQKLIDDENACNYLVRSKTFMGEGLIPVLTSASANVIYSSQNNNTDRAAFNAFDGDWDKSQLIHSTAGNNSTTWYANSSSNEWLGYDFTNPVLPSCFELRGPMYYYNNNYFFELYQFKAQYSDDNSNWFDASELITISDYSTHIYSIDKNSGAHRYWRIFCTTSYPTSTYIGIKNLQFYSAGIIGSQSAMRYIGLRNYAANILTNDIDWCDKIAKSSYYKLILNTEVPTMTSNTAPRGSVIVSTEYNPPTYAGFKAFDNSLSTWWHSTSGSATTPQYIGYDFDFNTVLKYVSYTPQFDNESDTLDLVIEAYDIDTSTWIPLNTSDTYLCTKQHYIMINNNKAYSKYRMYINKTYYHSSSNYYARLLEVYFYCRNDVTEGLNIYSAANDTVSITGNGVSLTCTTDSSGYGIIAEGDLPTGTYTFTSSVAKDPDNLSNDYSKQIVVTGKEIMTMVMPDEDIIYWWGYNNGLEHCEAATGWAVSGYSFATVTWNTNNVKTYTNGANFSYVGSKKTHNTNYLNVLYKGLMFVSNVAGEFNLGTTKNLLGGFQQQTFGSSTIDKLTMTNNGSDFYAYGGSAAASAGRSTEIYAIFGSN